MRPIHAFTPCLLILSLSVLTLPMLTGCRTAEQGGPDALRPAGAPASDGLAGPRPTPIRIDAEGGFARSTTQADIIDTRDFPVQIQNPGPWLGEVELVKNRLPAHSRDKTLPDTGEAPIVPVGTTRDVDRIALGANGFDGIAQTPWAPPDPTIAVGPGHVVQTVNQSIAWFTKAGVLQFQAPLGSPGNPGFFEPQGASTFTFDPKCFYDPFADRYVVVALEVYLDDNAAYIDLAISDDDDPNGVWYKYRSWAVISLGASTFWVDYPGLGYDENAIYVTGNLFNLTGPDGFGGALFRAYDKSSILSGGAASFVDLAPGTDASVQVGQTHGDSAPRTYFISRSATTAVKLWTMNDPTGTPALQSRIVGGLASAGAPVGDAPNPGGAIDTLDGRIMNVHVRGDRILTGHAVSAAGASGPVVTRWYDINTRGWPDSGDLPVLSQQGEIGGDSDEYTFFPAIGADRFGNAAVVMARASAPDVPSVVVSGRAVFDAPGSTSTPVTIATGTFGADGRWGDYFDIALDPLDDETFWLVGQTGEPFGWQSVIRTFSIGCPADLNGDGVASFPDVGAFLAFFASGDLRADFVPDGVVSFPDVSAFLGYFSQGCD